MIIDSFTWLMWIINYCNTLKEFIDQMERVCNNIPKDIYLDMGYKGKISFPVNIENHISRCKKKKITPWERMCLRRRNSIELIFSQANHYHRMDRNHLLGKAGDKNNVILSAVGCNFRKLILSFYFCLKVYSDKYLFILRSKQNLPKLGVLQEFLFI